MKSDGDLAQRLSESCVKLVLALLALSAVTYGVAQRVQNLQAFQPYWTFLHARADLEVLAQFLSGDPCWQ